VNTGAIFYINHQSRKLINNHRKIILEISEILLDASNNFYHAPYFLKDKKRDQAESLVF